MWEPSGDVSEGLSKEASGEGSGGARRVILPSHQRSSRASCQTWVPRGGDVCVGVAEPEVAGAQEVAGGRGKADLESSRCPTPMRVLSVEAICLSVLRRLSGGPVEKAVASGVLEVERPRSQEGLRRLAQRVLCRTTIAPLRPRKSWWPVIRSTSRRSSGDEASSTTTW